jgi:pterin-4a-carbinolamine dehydratase
MNHHPSLEYLCHRVRVAFHAWDAHSVTERHVALARRIATAVS